MNETPQPVKRRKGRSPGYPGIDLEAALARAETLWQAHRDHPVNVETVLQVWGYGRQSGAGLVALAALKKFGLLIDEGSGDARRARIAPDARAILLDQRPDSTERRERIRKAALAPAIHRELWNRYQGSLPGDAALSYYLTNERDFTENGARHFLSQFKRTVAFADLQPGGLANVSGDDQDIQDASLAHDGSDQSQGKLEQNRMNTGSPDAIQFPVGGTTVTVKLSAPLSTRDWERMIRLLDAMKPDDADE